MFRITHLSFRQLYDCHFDSICRFLAYYTTNRVTIEEVVQEVFVKLWEDREILKIESIKTYLYTSARNRMLNYLRDEKRRYMLLEQWIQHETGKEQGEECFDLDEFSQRVQKAIDSLPDKCREIFDMSKKEGFTYKHIAEKLNISVKTVETQMGIALRKIREQLATFYPE